MYKKIEKLGFLVSIIFGLSIFTSKALQNLSGSLLLFILFLLIILDFSVIKKLIIFCSARLTIGMLVFVFLTLFSFCINYENNFSTLRDLIRYFTFFSLVYFIDTDEKINFFLFSLLTSGILSILETLIIFTVNFNEWKKPYYRIPTSVDSLAHAGIISILVIFMFSYIFFIKFNSNKKLFFIILFIFLGIFTLIINKSKTAYVSFIPAILYLCIKMGWKEVFNFFIVLLFTLKYIPLSIKKRLLYLLSPHSEPSSILRMYFWDGAIKSIKESPYFGLSDTTRQLLLENYYKQKGVIDYINKMYGSKFSDIHNTYLQQWAQYGVFAFLAYIIFCFIVIPYEIYILDKSKVKKDDFFYFIKYSVSASLISYFISGISETTHLKQVMVYVFIILLFLLNYVSIRRENI